MSLPNLVLVNLNINIVDSRFVSRKLVKFTEDSIQDFLFKFDLNLTTRMHSSGMRTAGLLTVSQHALQQGGVYLGGCIRSIQWGRHPPWTDRHL